MSQAATTTDRQEASLLSVAGVAKAFGETKALSACNLTLRAGRIHAVIGENGSGKSTLVKVLTGVVQPDRGSVVLDGVPVHLTGPRQARRAGIATTFQEVLVLEHLSLVDNLWLGQDGLLRRQVDADRRRSESAAVLGELLGDELPDLSTRVVDLDLGMRQAAVIARSLLLKPRLLILDEATAALDIAVRDRLFATLRKRTAEGLAVLFITHKMDEIAALSDEVTVLRSGESVATLPIAEVTPARMLALMSGRSEPLSLPAAANGNGRLALTARDVRVSAHGAPFGLEIRSGEVLGLAGLEGHGAAFFAQILGGVRTPLGGRIESEGQVLTNPGAFVRHGIAYVPRDRKTEGVFAPLSIADNFSMSTLDRYTRFGLLDEGRIAASRQPLFARLGVKFGRLGDAITSLSGGNQQKVVLARTLARQPKVLVLNDPTRGVDLATKQDIYSLLAEQAEANVAVVIHSTEVEELLSLCQRVAVFHHGALFVVLDRQALSRDALIAGLFGRTA